MYERQHHHQRISEAHAQEFVWCFPCAARAGEAELCAACQHNSDALAILKRKTTTSAHVPTASGMTCAGMLLVGFVFGIVWSVAGAGWAWTFAAALVGGGMLVGWWQIAEDARARHRVRLTSDPVEAPDDLEP